MTIAEAKVAARFNSEVYFPRLGIHGYVYQISWVHPKGKEPFVTVGCHDLRANSVFTADPENLQITDWKCPEYMVQGFLEKEKK